MSTTVKPVKDDRVSVRVPAELRRQIEDAAAREERSVSNWLERTIRAALRRPEHDDGRKPEHTPAP